MSEKLESKHSKDQIAFSKMVGLKMERKLKAKRNSMSGVWFGLGMMGLIGWSVTIPTLLGVALGIWIDNLYTGGYSCTLMMLVIGLAIGCLNAWYWVSKEEKEIRKTQEDNDEK
jgi:ATP synthase protein I